MRDAAKKLVLILGSNVEEQWMRSVNLGVTNWTMEGLRSGGGSPLPFAEFSYALSASRLWKVQVYCPVVAMAMEQKLLFSLNYQQLEGVIQFVYTVTFKENWNDVTIKVDNIRCDLMQLVSETLMAKQGYGSDEKHFPSRISLQLPLGEPVDGQPGPRGRPRHGPRRVAGRAGVHRHRRLRARHGDPGPEALEVRALGARRHSVSELVPPRRRRQRPGGVLGRAARLRAAAAAAPARSWFRDRYTSPSRPFTRSGGVIFAGDEYGEGVCWRMCPAAAGRTVEWEMRARVWVTYWPNKKRTLHTETRRFEFRELLHLTVAETAE